MSCRFGLHCRRISKVYINSGESYTNFLFFSTLSIYIRTFLKRFLLSFYHRDNWNLPPLSLSLPLSIASNSALYLPYLTRAELTTCLVRAGTCHVVDYNQPSFLPDCLVLYLSGWNPWQQFAVCLFFHYASSSFAAACWLVVDCLAG